MRTSGLALLLLLGLAACGGGLSTPDLATGEVTGRLVNVQDPAKAHVYVVGHPETVAKVAADGSYTLSNVPAGENRVVFYDGKDRAGVVEGVRVEGAKRASVTKDAADLPVAARVVVVARPSGGCKWANATLSIDGTIFQDLPGGAAELFPVPPGQWTVRGKLKGFKAKDRAVAVAPASTEPLELSIDELDDSAARGCLSAQCEGSLQCASDGKCYTCNADADCGAGFQCHDHTCVVPGVSGEGGGGDTCAACANDAECQTTAGAGYCRKNAGAATGYCMTSPVECRRGYAVYPEAGASWCGPIPYFQGVAMGEACQLVARAFGSACVQDSTCSGVISNGVCAKPSGATTGSCTITCGSGGDCPKVAGFDHCNNGVCGR